MYGSYPKSRQEIGDIPALRDQLLEKNVSLYLFTNGGTLEKAALSDLPEMSQEVAADQTKSGALRALEDLERSNIPTGYLREHLGLTEKNSVAAWASADC